MEFYKSWNFLLGTRIAGPESAWKKLTTRAVQDNAEGQERYEAGVDSLLEN